MPRASRRDRSRVGAGGSGRGRCRRCRGGAGCPRRQHDPPAARPGGGIRTHGQMALVAGRRRPAPLRRFREDPLTRPRRHVAVSMKLMPASSGVGDPDAIVVVRVDPHAEHHGSKANLLTLTPVFPRLSSMAQERRSKRRPRRWSSSAVDCAHDTQFGTGDLGGALAVDLVAWSQRNALEREERPRHLVVREVATHLLAGVRCRQRRPSTRSRQRGSRPTVRRGARPPPHRTRGLNAGRRPRPRRGTR